MREAFPSPEELKGVSWKWRMSQQLSLHCTYQQHSRVSLLQQPSLFLSGCRRNSTLLGSLLSVSFISVILKVLHFGQEERRSQRKGQQPTSFVQDNQILLPWQDGTKRWSNRWKLYWARVLLPSPFLDACTFCGSKPLFCYFIYIHSFASALPILVWIQARHDTYTFYFSRICGQHILAGGTSERGRFCLK